MKLHGAYVLLVRNGRVLVLRREEEDHPLFKGIWDVPGGIVEADEDALSAALRETEEETGLRVQRSRLLREWEHTWEDGGTFRVTIFIAGEYKGELRLSSEHSSYAWMTPSEILEQDFEDHQLESPVFRSWLEGWREVLHILSDRLSERA